MRRFALAPTLILAASLLGSACKGPEIASPYTGTTRFLCCNLWYEKPKITDIAWQVGTKVPFGTRVRVDHVFRNEIQFTPDGQPTITLVYKYGEKALPFETYLGKFLLDDDPHARLRKVPAKRVQSIEQGLVEAGMTKEQVLMTRGIPPAHRTPSLDSPTWTYWQNRWDSLVVYFVGDKVDRIGH